MVSNPEQLLNVSEQSVSVAKQLRKYYITVDKCSRAVRSPEQLVDVLEQLVSATEQLESVLEQLVSATKQLQKYSGAVG